MLITDWSRGRDAELTRVARVLEAGPQVAVQHRHPEATTRAFLEEARALSRLCEGVGAPLFVNSRLDVALEVGAHVHVAAHALRVGDVRPHLPTGRWLSHAVHSLAEAQPGADLALVSPVFAPNSKTNDTRATLGPEGFAELARQLPCPAFALGGVTPESALALRGPWVAGYASIHGLLTADDARALLRRS